MSLNRIKSVFPSLHSSCYSAHYMCSVVILTIMIWGWLGNTYILVLRKLLWNTEANKIKKE